jgi:hypothetical protein
MNIAEVIPQENFILYIRFDDGRNGLFDVKPYLDSEVFSPLRNKTEFERFYNGKYFIEWDCGADLSADTIQARLVSKSTVVAQQSAPADFANAPPLS